MSFGCAVAQNRAFTLCRGCSAAPRPGIGPGSPPAKSPIRSRVAPRAAPSRRLPVVPQLIVRAAASRVPLRRRAPELVTSPPGSPAHAQSLPSQLPPRRPAPALIPGRVAAIAPGRPAPVGTPRRGNFLLLYTSGRGAAFRRGQGVVNAPRCASNVVRDNNSLHDTLSRVQGTLYLPVQTDGVCW